MISSFKKVLATFTIASFAFNLQAAPRAVESHKVKSYYNSELLTSQFSSWGIAPNKRYSIGLEKAWKSFKKKRDVVVAVVDTGVDPNHPFLKDNLYMNNQEVTKSNYGYDFSKGRKSAYTPFDQHGHGTHVAGIIKSIFPDVKLMVLKYYNPQASGQDNLNSTIEALRYAVKMNVDIINYSGGGPEPAAEEKEILREARRKGILIVAAAGNEESNIDNKKNAYFPASYGFSNIITVTAHDENLKVLPSSNYGKKTVDIVAPGYRIKSAFPFKRAGYLTGTSQATAFVTGIAALILAGNGSLEAEKIKSILKLSAHQELSFMGKCSSNGRLDAGRALEMAKKYTSARRNIAAKSKNQKASRIYYRLN